jgi:hypothetical protein
VHCVLTRVSQVLGCAVAALAVSACATLPGAGKRSPTLAHVPVVALPDGNEAVLIRSFSDEQKTPEGDRRVQVDYLWDYTDAIARRRTFDSSGAMIEDEREPGLTLNATQPELDWAIAIVKADPDVSVKLVPEVVYYGGFSFREPGHPDCDLRSRCIHVIGSRDGGRRKVFHALVDLQTARVVAPDYDPALGGFDDTIPQ